MKKLRREFSASGCRESIAHPNPSVALVCDWLTEKGGAEKVLLELHRLYPDAPIYTSQYRPKRIDWFKDATVKTGWLNLFPAAFRRILPVLRQFYFSHLDLSHYDLVISVTGAEAKAVRTQPKPYRTATRQGKYEVLLPDQPHTTHICYCHVPTQYYWQSYDRYLKNPGFGIFSPFVKFFFRLLVKPLRKADFAAAKQPDYFVTISSYAAEQIKKYYHRDATIIYPPVDVQKFSKFVSTSVKPVENSSKSVEKSVQNPVENSNSNPNSNPNLDPRSNQPQGSQPFVISCRQVTWKRVDLAISACNRLGLPLQVIGDGPEHKKLQQLAAKVPTRDVSHIEFLPWLTSDQLAERLGNARAFIFPSLEPFGIAPVEALAAGCPVIAFADGGSRDFVHLGKNGLFFREQTVDSLVTALKDFENHQFNRKEVAASALPFDISKFRQGITDFIDQALQNPAPRSASTSEPTTPKSAPAPKLSADSLPKSTPKDSVADAPKDTKNA